MTTRTPAKVTDNSLPVFPDRATKEFDIADLFGLKLPVAKNKDGTPKLDGNGNPVVKRKFVMGYAKPGPETPKIDPTYVFPEEETKVILLGLMLKDRMLLTGHTGTGKSTLIQQIAARLNYNCVRVNFDGAITRQDLVGEWVVKGKDMEFQYGILPRAFSMPGTIILLDEWDSISGECNFVLQRPLEKDDGNLMLLEKGGELIPLHPDNTIIATANTRGMGDESGLYSHGTRVQNYAQLNRFGMTIELGYMSAEQEEKILSKQFKSRGMDEEEIKNLVKAVHLIREAFTNGELDAPLSPRDLINWADKYLRMGDPMRAATYCFLNRMSPEDRECARGIMQRCFKVE